MPVGSFFLISFRDPLILEGYCAKKRSHLFGTQPGAPRFENHLHAIVDNHVTPDLDCARTTRGWGQTSIRLPLQYLGNAFERQTGQLPLADENELFDMLAR